MNGACMEGRGERFPDRLRKTPYRKGESAMSEALKERKEMDPQYQWDLTKMYASDAEQRCQHS